MSELRVGVDVTSLLGPPAGIHQVTSGLVEALSRRDDLVVSGWILSARGAIPETTGIDVHRARVPASVAARSWARTRFPGRRLTAGDVDVVHGTNFLAPPAPTSVVSLQDLTPITHPEWCVPAVAAMAGAIRSAAKRGAHFHVSSELVAHEAHERLGVDHDRLHLVHHAITPVEGGDADAGRRLAGADRYVLALGTVEQRKNIAATLTALDHLPTDVRLVIAGSAGNDEATVDAARHRHGDRIVRLTTVTNIDRASLLEGATVLAFPSPYEGFGLPPLEAASISTPFVATAVGALPELAGNDVELVTPGDDADFVERLVEAVARPLAPPERLRDRVLRRSWDVVAAEMMPVYAAAHDSMSRA